MIKKILVPLDGTEVADPRSSTHRSLRSAAGAGLALVKVVHASSGTAESALQEAEAYLARLADDLTHMGMNVGPALITMGLQRIGFSGSRHSRG